MQARNCKALLSTLTGVSSIKKLVAEFPNEKETILEYIESNFKKIVKDPFALRSLISIFKEYEERLIAQLMIQENFMQLTITHAYYLFLMRCFPEHVEMLCKQLSLEENFHRLIRDAATLNQLIPFLPSYNKEISTLLLMPDNFNQLVMCKNPSSLVWLINCLGEEYEAALSFLCEPEYFSKIVTNGCELHLLITHLPAYQDRLFELFLNPDYFKMIEIDITMFNQFVNDFPIYREKLLALLFQPENFSRIIDSVFLIIDNVRRYPEYQAIFIQKLLEPEHLKRIIKNRKDFILMPETDYQNAIFDALIEAKHMDAVFECERDVIRAVTKYPHKTNFLLDMLFSPENPRQLFSSVWEMGNVLQHYPDYESRMIENIYKQTFFENLFKSSVHFQIFDEINQLSGRHKYSVNFKQAVFIMLCKPENFKRIIIDTRDLEYFSTQFPKHDDIFKQATLDEAAVKAAAYLLHLKLDSHESKAYTRGAVVGAFLSSEYAGSLDPNFLIYMSGFFSRSEGGRFARTCRRAKDTANYEVTLLATNGMR